MAHGVALLLLSMIGGYWVLERASAHKGQLKSIGQLVGAVVLIVSLVGIACKVWCLASSKSAFCPYWPKSAVPSPR